VDRVVALVGRLLPRGAVGILGLSYKPDTVVVEESQGVAIASQLANEGYKVVAHDPQASDAANAVLGGKVEIVGDAESCVSAVDVLVIATAWPGFRNISQQAFHRSNSRLTVIDCWRMLPSEDFADLVDIVYLGKGFSQTIASPAVAATA
jgi:UDPglucose 6-dehydrogenase